MKTKSTPIELLIVAITLAPIIYLAINWNQLPAQIATHYNANGQPDGWSGKEAAAVGLGGLSIGMYVLLLFLPHADPKGRLQTSNYQKLRLVITLFLTTITGFLFYTATDPSHLTLPTGAILGLVGLMLAGIGNYIVTIKPNYFVGIRTPWTLESETVWRKTHRTGGRLMVAGGLLITVLAFLLPVPYSVSAVVGVILLVALIPVIYSYIYFRQEKTHQLN